MQGFYLSQSGPVLKSNDLVLMADKRPFEWLFQLENPLVPKRLEIVYSA
jgi:hypothetical protein